MIWIGRVFIGWYNKLFKHPTEQAIARMNICKNCEFRKKIGKMYYCSICYCEIEAKCSSPDEKCLKGKW